MRFRAVKDARGGIRRVTLGGDALVPIVIRVGGVLQFDRFQPGILARRLIEMAVNADVFHSASAKDWNFFRTTNE